MRIMYLRSNAEIALKKVLKEKKRKCVLIQDTFHTFHGMPEAAVDFKDMCADFCKDVIN